LQSFFKAKNIKGISVVKSKLAQNQYFMKNTYKIIRDTSCF